MGGILIEKDGFRIRNAVPEDLEAIMAVENDAFIQGIREDTAVFAKRLSVFGSGFFVIEEICTCCDGDSDKNSKVIGYFCSEIWDSVPVQNDCFLLGHNIEEFHKENGSAFYISSIALLKEYEGKGLGSWMFNACVESVRVQFLCIKKMVLLVNENWAGARRIYSRYGFMEYDRLPGFFCNGDGILMSCTV